MPVAKLSREFYEKFGDKLTDELVNCLNSIDGSYRAELKDLFEAHFGRFEETLERRLVQTTAEIGARIEQVRAELRAEFRTELHAELGSVRSDIGSVKGEIRSVRSEIARSRETSARSGPKSAPSRRSCSNGTWRCGCR